VENTLLTTPGAINTATAAKNRVLDGLKKKAEQTRDMASSKQGPTVAGELLQRDLRDNIKGKRDNVYGPLNNKADNLIEQERNGVPVQYPIDNTRKTLANLTALNPDSPNYSSGAIHPDIADINKRVQADLAMPGGQLPTGKFTTSSVVPQPIMEHGPNIGGIRSMRSDVGARLGESTLLGSRQKAPLKQLYGALSEDRMNAAKITDMQAGPQLNNKGPAMRASKRADRYYTSLDNRADAVQPLVDMANPEDASRAYLGYASQNSGSLKALRQTKRTLGKEARAANTSTWIDKMGRATPGNQDDLSEVWSASTFLTNWNQSSPAARRELLSGFDNATQVSKDMDAIARAASMVKESSKMFANPSGTAASSSLRKVLAGTGAVSLLLHPLATAATVGVGLGVSKATAHTLMASPKFISWLAEPTKKTSLNLPGHLFRLSVIAGQSKDPEFQKAADEYINTIQAQSSQ